MSQLHIDNLSVEYRTDDELITAVDRVSLDIAPGEIVGVVGESGSGKSTVAKSVLRILNHNGRIKEGSIRYGETELTELTEMEMSESIRGSKIAMVFQDPHASLSPVSPIGEQLTDFVVEHTDVGRSEAKDRAIRHLREVGISNPVERFDSYPQAFSGGMLQRVVLAIAIAGEPDILIADEPTTGLDMTIQAQTLDRLESLNENSGMGIILITHDLDVVQDICDRVAVMYDGNVIETGSCQQIINDPKHPYSAELINATLQDALDRDPEKTNPIQDAAEIGCPYHPSCPESFGDVCETGDIPSMYETDGRPVRCHLYDAEGGEN